MSTTTNPLDPITNGPRDDSGNNKTLIASTVTPFCIFVLIFVAIWRIKRRVRRAGHIKRTSVYVIPSNGYYPRSIPYEPKVIPGQAKSFNHLDTPTSLPDVTNSSKKLKRNVNLNIRIIPKKTKNVILSADSFPREPIYRSQESPSYIVPFSALPPNFDFSLKCVEVHSDFVVIKDLDILQTYWYESEPDKEEYRKQSPLNPNFI